MRARWLADQGIEAVLVNPHLVKKYRENSDNTLTVEPGADSSQWRKNSRVIDRNRKGQIQI
ncbi:hypothetical protein [Paenibacillus xylanexedens]|uniref:hypothetical protein n=1 Tax=Paenibacillus xylanexedens TaxID=528191 RepID=UPI003D077FF6